MNDDRTALIGGSGGPAAADTAAAEGCPACQTSIPAGEQFCPRCGYQRGTWRQHAATQGSATQGPATASTDPALWVLRSEGGASYELPAGEVLVGRGDVPVKLDDGFVSRQHARLDVSADGVTVTDLGSSNGTFSGERRLAAQESVTLAPGDSIKFAHTTFTLERAAQPVAAAEPVEAPQAEASGETQALDSEGTNVMPELSQQPDDTPVDPASQPDPGKEGHTPHHASVSHWQLARDGGEPIPLPLGETVLGRKAEGTTRVIEGDSYVSGVHCRIIATEKTLEVTDLGSTNGSFVNGGRLEAQQPWALSGGDTLRLGQSEFMVENLSLTQGQEETLEEE